MEGFAAWLHSSKIDLKNEWDWTLPSPSQTAWNPELPDLPPDLILVGEFSELKGPIPLLTIPPLVTHTGKLNSDLSHNAMQDSKQHNASCASHCAQRKNHCRNPTENPASECSGNLKRSDSSTSQCSNVKPGTNTKFTPRDCAIDDAGHLMPSNNLGILTFDTSEQRSDIQHGCDNSNDNCSSNLNSNFANSPLNHICSHTSSLEGSNCHTENCNLKGPDPAVKVSGLDDDHKIYSKRMPIDLTSKPTVAPAQNVSNGDSNTTLSNDTTVRNDTTVVDDTTLPNDTASHKTLDLSNSLMQLTITNDSINYIDCDSSIQSNPQQYISTTISQPSAQNISNPFFTQSCSCSQQPCQCDHRVSMVDQPLLRTSGSCEASNQSIDMNSPMEKCMQSHAADQNPYYHGVNLNDLVLKLMSTDYQSFGGEFSIPQDSEVIEEDFLGEFAGISGVVRYITLHDVQARGFVRPLCVAYLTWDPAKLRCCRDRIRASMSKASNYLKSSNLCWFAWELLQRVDDLRYTKDRYIAEMKRYRAHQAFNSEDGTHSVSEETLNLIDGRLSVSEQTTPDACEETTHEAFKETNHDSYEEVLILPTSDGNGGFAKDSTLSDKQSSGTRGAQCDINQDKSRDAGDCSPLDNIRQSEQHRNKNRSNEGDDWRRTVDDCGVYSKDGTEHGRLQGLNSEQECELRDVTVTSDAGCSRDSDAIKFTTDGLLECKKHNDSHVSSSEHSDNNSSNSVSVSMKDTRDDIQTNLSIAIVPNVSIEYHDQSPQHGIPISTELPSSSTLNPLYVSSSQVKYLAQSPTSSSYPPYTHQPASNLNTSMSRRAASMGSPARPSPGNPVYEVLQHTSLSSLATQLLDCQRMVTVITEHMGKIREIGELQQLVDLISSQVQSSLFAVMNERNLFNTRYTVVPYTSETTASSNETLAECNDFSTIQCIYEDRGQPYVNVDLSSSETQNLNSLSSIEQTALAADLCSLGTAQEVNCSTRKLVIPLSSNHRLQTLRCLCGLSGVGFVACISELMHLHEGYKKPGLALMFEGQDQDCYDNDAGTLFVGNVPVVNIVSCKNRIKDRTTNRGSDNSGLGAAKKQLSSKNSRINAETGDISIRSTVKDVTIDKEVSAKWKYSDSNSAFNRTSSSNTSDNSDRGIVKFKSSICSNEDIVDLVLSVWAVEGRASSPVPIGRPCSCEADARRRAMLRDTSSRDGCGQGGQSSTSQPTDLSSNNRSLTASRAGPNCVSLSIDDLCLIRSISTSSLLCGSGSGTNTSSGSGTNTSSSSYDTNDGKVLNISCGIDNTDSFATCGDGVSSGVYDADSFATATCGNVGANSDAITACDSSKALSSVDGLLHYSEKNQDALLCFNIKDEHFAVYSGVNSDCVNQGDLPLLFNKSNPVYGSNRNLLYSGASVSNDIPNAGVRIQPLEVNLVSSETHCAQKRNEKRSHALSEGSKSRRRKGDSSRGKKYKSHPRQDIEQRMATAHKYHLSTLLLRTSGAVSESLLAALLCGRRVVVAARRDRQRVAVHTVMALAATLLPVAQDNVFPVTRYHRGTITPHHLQQQPLLGLCIPERLKLPDLMDAHTLSKITLVNLSTGYITGVDYYGNFIHGMSEFKRLFKLRESNPGSSTSKNSSNAMKQKNSGDKRSLLVSQSATGSVQAESVTSRGSINTSAARSSFSRSASTPNVASRCSADSTPIDAGLENSFCINPSPRFGSSNLDLSDISTKDDNTDLKTPPSVKPKKSAVRQRSSPTKKRKSLYESIEPTDSILSDSARSPTFQGLEVLSTDACDCPPPNKDAPLQSYLQSLLVQMGLQVYLYFHVCGNCTMAPNRLMSIMHVEERNDGQILEYLSSIVSRQLDLAKIEVDYLP